MSPDFLQGTGGAKTGQQLRVDQALISDPNPGSARPITSPTPNTVVASLPYYAILRLLLQRSLYWWQGIPPFGPWLPLSEPPPRPYQPSWTKALERYR